MCKDLSRKVTILTGVMAPHTPMGSCLVKHTTLSSGREVMWRTLELTSVEDFTSQKDKKESQKRTKVSAPSLV